jgi:hypothetical protein
MTMIAKASRASATSAASPLGAPIRMPFLEATTRIRKMSSQAFWAGRGSTPIRGEACHGEATRRPRAPPFPGAFQQFRTLLRVEIREGRVREAYRGLREANQGVRQVGVLQAPLRHPSINQAVNYQAVR